MKKNNRISALFFLLLSFFVCQQSVVIGVGSLSQPGPGLLAFGAGAGIGVLALWFLIQSFVSKESRGEVTHHGKTLQRGRFLMICTSLFVYTIAVNWLGFLLSTFLFVIFVLRLIESKMLNQYTCEIGCENGEHLYSEWVRLHNERRRFRLYRWWRDSY